MTILTRHGCECQEEYNDPLTKENVKNKCIYGTGTDKWCKTKGECGKKSKIKSENGKEYWWDYCDPSHRSVFSKEWVYSANYNNTVISGFMIYLVVFVICIPAFLYYREYYELLEVYMPNFDLLATAISYNAGPGESRIFEDLYNAHSENLLGFMSTTFINYISLLGITFLIARRAVRHRSILKGFSVGLVMILFTYLLPNDIMSWIQSKISDILKDEYKLKPRIDTIYYYIIAIIGLFIAYCFILIEKFILQNPKYILKPIYNFAENIKNAIEGLR